MSQSKMNGNFLSLMKGFIGKKEQEKKERLEESLNLRKVAFIEKVLKEADDDSDDEGNWREKAAEKAGSFRKEHPDVTDTGENPMSKELESGEEEPEASADTGTGGRKGLVGKRTIGKDERLNLFSAWLKSLTPEERADFEDRRGAMSPQEKENFINNRIKDQMGKQGLTFSPKTPGYNLLRSKLSPDQRGQGASLVGQALEQYIKTLFSGKSPSTELSVFVRDNVPGIKSIVAAIRKNPENIDQIVADAAASTESGKALDAMFMNSRLDAYPDPRETEPGAVGGSMKPGKLRRAGEPSSSFITRAEEEGMKKNVRLGKTDVYGGAGGARREVFAHKKLAQRALQAAKDASDAGDMARAQELKQKAEMHQKAADAAKQSPGAISHMADVGRERVSDLMNKGVLPIDELVKLYSYFKNNKDEVVRANLASVRGGGGYRGADKGDVTKDMAIGLQGSPEGAKLKDLIGSGPETGLAPQMQARKLVKTGDLSGREWESLASDVVDPESQNRGARYMFAKLVQKMANRHPGATVADVKRILSLAIERDAAGAMKGMKPAEIVLAQVPPEERNLAKDVIEKLNPKNIMSASHPLDLEPPFKSFAREEAEKTEQNIPALRKVLQKRSVEDATQQKADEEQLASLRAQRMNPEELKSAREQDITQRHAGKHASIQRFKDMEGQKAEKRAGLGREIRGLNVAKRSSAEGETPEIRSAARDVTQGLEKKVSAVRPAGYRPLYKGTPAEQTPEELAGRQAGALHRRRLAGVSPEMEDATNRPGIDSVRGTGALSRVFNNVSSEMGKMGMSTDKDAVMHAIRSLIQTGRLPQRLLASMDTMEKVGGRSPDTKERAHSANEPAREPKLADYMPNLAKVRSGEVKDLPAPKHIGSSSKETVSRSEPRIKHKGGEVSMTKSDPQGKEPQPPKKEKSAFEKKKEEHKQSSEKVAQSGKPIKSYNPSGSKESGAEYEERKRK